MPYWVCQSGLPQRDDAAPGYSGMCESLEERTASRVRQESQVAQAQCLSRIARRSHAMRRLSRARPMTLPESSDVVSRDNDEPTLGSAMPDSQDCEPGRWLPR